MKRFLKHFLYMLVLVPAVLIILLVTRCAMTYEIVDQYGVITKSTTTMADGTIYMEKYDYDHGFTNVTIEYYENDILIRTEQLALTEDDPLLHDTFEVLPHPTATAATTERVEDGSRLTLRCFDADGDPEGHSVILYNTWDRLAKQEDFDAAGNLLRTTLREFAGHTISKSSLP